MVKQDFFIFVYFIGQAVLEKNNSEYKIMRETLPFQRTVMEIHNLFIKEVKKNNVVSKMLSKIIIIFNREFIPLTI